MSVLFPSRLASQNVAGRIAGEVFDPSHAAIPDVNLNAENLASGQIFKAASNSVGLYTFPELPIGEYRVTAEHAGFTTQVFEKVTVDVGDTVRLEVNMPVGPMEQQAEVTSQAPVLDASGATAGATMQNDQIVGLPINGRDYGRFSLLTPGAVLRGGYIADLTFDGLQSGNNQFSIDGIDATRVDEAYMSNGSERGARLLTGSLDTISEFKVQSGDYSAEYGRASGAYINIVTKSGTNHFHGTAFEFLRNDSLDARNFFQLPGQPAPIRFNNFGGNLGGPIRRNTTFFFANYEASRQSVGIVGSGTELSIQGMAQAAPAVQPVVALMPTPGNKSQFLTDVALTPTSNPLVDAVSFLGVNHVNENTGSARVDKIWSDSDTSFIRANINGSSVTGPLIGVFPTAFGILDHQAIDTQTTNLALGEIHTFSPRLVNTALIGMQRYSTSLDESEPFPVIIISGLNFSPGNRGLYGREPTDIQTGDSITFIKSRHTIKAGVTVWRIDEPYHGFNGGSSVTFTSIQNFLNNVVATAVITPAVPGNTTFMTEAGPYVSDTWRIRPGFIVNLGLRWDWNQVPHSNWPTRVWTNFTNSLTDPGAPYFSSCLCNWAPRIGTAWMPASKLVLRAGYGFFIEALPIGNFYNQVVNTLPGSATFSNVNIPNLAFPITQFISSGAPPPPSLNGFDWHTRNPRTIQWTAGLGYQLSSSTALFASYVGNHAFNLDVDNGVNYVNPITGIRPFSQYSNITLDTWTGQSKYNAVQVSMRRRLAAGLQFSGEYSWAHATANVPDDGFYPTNPQQPFDMKVEWGNSDSDTRHNLSFNVLYALPIGRGQKVLGSSPRIVNVLAGGWSLAALGLIRTGVANTVYLGTNTYGNGDTTNQRPDYNPGVSLYVPRNSPAPPDSVPYLNFKAFSLPPQAVAPADGQPGVPGMFGTAPIGDFVGPGFAQIDVSLIKDIPIHENFKAEFRGEVFNIFNHPNFDSPTLDGDASNVWSPTGAASFGIIQNTVGRTIGFGTARQIQLALRCTF
ncbi:MAG TPA: carboxypeptidase regulatory-like domain-containing protein [Bryobacteraceae bacterium]